MPRFSDIDTAQTIHDSSYRVHIPLRDLVENVDRYSDKYQLDLDPDYQRGYVWTTEQKEKFMEFMLTGGATASGNNIIRFNVPGFLGNKQSGRMEVVDGKQRLTTCLGFLNNEVKAFGYYYNEYEDELPWTNVDLIFTINALTKRSDILRWYLQINGGGTIHTEEELSRVRELYETSTISE